MKQMKKKLFFPGAVGYSFMLTMLVVLVFVAFGVLSLSASLRDYEYSQRVAKKTTAYYKANTKAYEILSEIDMAFTLTDTLEDAVAAVYNLPEVTVSTDTEGRNTISYEVEMNDRQKLQIHLAVTEDTSGKAAYKVAEWKEVPSSYWKKTTYLPVIGSE